ncbi:mandelate racemase/muconate lactonizing enzyme family protein [Amycolatopsis sp. DSM 110486]|uniref:mandelate racemase/muconate lactonizing enzyme family protein n=1 Tax=Amycolatopsis sp. DSM 110486 TaxID=2865832 RepID=UPI001C69DD57|nr:mandelate racemase/muconate lactonizing enzyme family protein [Amycolatopsis sp. DSM 110486]QYN22657.1 mandelate racemase/muconate lactonizing enzyme family protein [Amycolatopsis sp. DSM 110486]
MPSITDVTTAWSRLPLGAGRGGSGATKVDLLLVTVTDDEGATGTGFTYALTGGADGVHAVLTGTVRDHVVGADLDHWPRVWQRVRDDTHRLGRGLALPALSAVDIAVWDLRARRAGSPLFRFLGAHHDDVEIYGSGRATHAMPVEQLVDGTRAYLDEGYHAVKLRIGARRAEEDVARVRAVREAVGDDVRIMVDANERLDLPTALWTGARLADLGVYWLEEPLSSDDVTGHATLAAAVPMPVAVGEHLHGRFEFAAYLHARAASVLQPDVPLTGGVTEWLRISAIAEAFGATLSPHFLPELHVHLAAAVPNCPYVEHFPLIDDVLQETLTVHNGRVAPPDRPGHGMLWDLSALDDLRVR